MQNFGVKIPSPRDSQTCRRERRHARLRSPSSQPFSQREKGWDEGL